MAGIGDWDAGYLLRFVRVALTGDPIPPGSVLAVEDLILRGDINLTKGRLVQSGVTNGKVMTMQNGIWKPL